MQMCGRLGVYHLHQDREIAEKEIFKPDGKLALCTNSLERFLDPKYFVGKVVIVDEFMSTINHLLNSKTHRKNRKKCIELFVTCLQSASHRIFLDGHSADWAIDYFRRFLGDDHPFIKLENIHKPRRASVEFVLGSLDSKGKEKKSDYSKLTRAILSGRKIGVICDSQKHLESLEKILESMGKSGIRVDSKTLADKDHPAIDFVKNCDKWIRKNEPDYVLISPSFAEGGDISIRGYFTDVYALFHGVLGVDSLRQFMGRFRDPEILFHVWCREYGFKQSSVYSSQFKDTISRRIGEFLNLDVAAIAEGRETLLEQLTKQIEQSKDDPHIEAWARLQAIDNYEKSNLREAFKEMLIKDGYSLRETYLGSDEGAANELKLARHDVEYAEAEAIFKAEDITTQEAEALSRDFSATWEQRCSIRRRAILDKLPDIESSQIWSVEFILEFFVRDRTMVAAAEMLYYFRNPDESIDYQKNLWAAIALGGDSFLPDIRSRRATLSALNYLKIPELLRGEQTIFSASDLSEFIRLGKHKKVKTALGFQPGKDAVKYAQKVLRIIGADLAYSHRGTNGIRFYKLKQPLENSDPQIATALAEIYYRIDIRHREIQARIEASEHESEWEKLVKKLESENHPETPSIQAIDQPPDHAFNHRCDRNLAEMDVQINESPPEDPEPQKINWPDFHIERYHPRMGWVKSYFVERYEGAVAIIRSWQNWMGQVFQSQPIEVPIEDVRRSPAPDWWSILPC